MGNDLFEKEQEDLLADLTDIPKKACDRRVCCYSSSGLIPGFTVLCKHGQEPAKHFQWKFLYQINEFVKRARAAKIHAYIISHLRKEMPAVMGKAKAQQKLSDNLEEEFRKV